jgi:hypothetical protein
MRIPTFRILGQTIGHSQTCDTSAGNHEIIGTAIAGLAPCGKLSKFSGRLDDGGKLKTEQGTHRYVCKSTRPCSESAVKDRAVSDTRKQCVTLSDLYSDMQACAEVKAQYGRIVILCMLTTHIALY